MEANPGTRVLYYDYLGFEHSGTILLTQPCQAPDVAESDEEGEVHYLYLKDDRDEFNDKEYTNPVSGQKMQYAEIRRSDECIRIYKKEDLT